MKGGMNELGGRCRCNSSHFVFKSQLPSSRSHHPILYVSFRIRALKYLSKILNTTRFSSDLDLIMSHLQTKFNFEYSRLLSGEQPWNATSSTPTLTPSSTSRSKGKSSQHPRSRYFQDLLCLKVEYKTLRSLIDGIGNRILLDDEPDSKGARIRENLNGIWRECLEIWKEANEKVGIRQESQEEEDQEIGLEMEDDRRKNAVQVSLPSGIGSCADMKASSPILVISRCCSRGNSESRRGRHAAERCYHLSSYSSKH